MISETVYTIEILLEHRRGARPGVFNVIAIDRHRQRVFEAGVADLNLAGKAVALPSGRPLLADEFLGRFRRGAPASAEHGVAFGRMLLGFLLADPRVARAWNEMQSRRMASGLPMRLLLRLPRLGQVAPGGLGDAAAEPPVSVMDVSAIPFELLADEHGFLFKDRGHALVRVIDPASFADEPPEGAAETRRAGTAAPNLMIGGAPPRHASLGAGAGAGASPGAGGRELAWVAPTVQMATSVPLPLVEETVRAWSLQGSAALGTLTGERTAAPLPEPSPSFRGRGPEIHQALTLLAKERLVSIFGMPGIGKTDLAAAIAHRALYDGDLELESARWFSLDGLTEVDALRARMALALGLDPRRCKSDEHLAKGIGNGPTLFVLDGAEVLLRDPLTRTRFQWLLNTLLQECAKMRFLVVTRKRIGEVAASGGDIIVAKEVVVPVGPLPAPWDREMFLAAAGARLSHDEQRSNDLSDLLTALMGHPRSIQLAATVTGAGMSLSAIRDRALGTPPGEGGGEGGGERGGAARVEVPRPSAVFGTEEGTDEDVRAGRYLRCLNLSLEVLKATDPRAVEVLAWLGNTPSGLPEVLLPHVFGQGASREGALLLREGLADRRDVDRCIRLTAPLAGFALRQSEVIGEARHAALLQASLRAIGAWLSTSGGQPGLTGAGMDRDRAVQQESNLAALVLAIPEPAPKDQAEPLAKAVASAIVPFAAQMIRVGRARAASEVCREAVRRIVPLGTGTPLAAVLTALGDLFVRIERLADAEQVYEQALPLYRALSDQLSEASTLQALGDVFARGGRIAEAEVAFQRALPLFQGIEDRLGEATALRSLGDLFLRTDRFKEAEDAYEKVLPMYRTLGERLGEARTLQALGDLLQRTDRLKEAEQAYSRALPLYKTLDEALGEANTLQALGDVRLRTDRLKEAEEAYAQARTLYHAVEDALGEANTLRSLGELFLRTDRLLEAERAFRQVLPIYRSVEDKVGQANTLQSMGKLALARQDGEAAFGWFLSALKLHQAAEDRLGVGGDRGYLARAARVAGQPLRAAVLGGLALGGLDREDDRFGQLVALRDLARSLAALGEQKGAVAAWFMAWARARAIGDPSAPSIAAMLSETFQDFDAAAQPSPEVMERYERELAEVLQSCEARLKEAGEDPYAPMKTA
jgi:tetratricopeptide (TPR) repeat protein